MNAQTQFKRSPLKAKPPRLPGQSLDEQISELYDNQISFYTTFTALAFALIVVDWYRWFAQQPLQPWLTTVFSAFVIAYSAWKLKGYKSQVNRLKLGRDGEREVGAALEELRRQGCAVFHDLQGEGFNLDHVVVAPQGVYLIETKTRRKPRGDRRVSYDGRRVLVDGRTPERDPVVQAERGARWLRDLLRESTGKRFPVRPVVVYPGWYVESKKRPQDRGVWVLNPKQLSAYLSRSPKVLEDSDLHLAAYHLARYVQLR